MFHNGLNEQQLRQYYKEVQQQYEQSCDLKGQPVAIKNRARSYLVTVFKGNHQMREIPKDLYGKTARNLKLLAMDRELTQSMCEFSQMQKRVMNEHANSINEQRDREIGFGDALRDLVRLARMNNVAREHSEMRQS